METRILHSSLAAVIVCVSASMALAQPVSPGELRQYATSQSIGFEWDVTGDGNHDATVNVRYRVSGTTEWRDALPLFRIDFNGANMVAGSILFVSPGTEYEVELDMTDPDGGGETRSTLITTRSIPAMPTGGRTFYVTPGSGGGDGSEADPFRGIDAAQAGAMPGDIFLVGPGDYGGGGTVNLDAAGTVDDYIVWIARDVAAPPRLGEVRLASYVWLEGFDLSATTNVIRHLGASVGAVVKGNRITGCDYCIHLGDGAEGWWITDNVIIGVNDPAGGSFGGEGVELAHTSHHTVAYNSISRVADGISYPHTNVDIFANDIFETSDDGVEADDGYANVRVWANRIRHANNNGITFQPMNGAPWYVIRNQVIGSSGSVLKVRDAVDRVLLAHNTFVGWSRVYQHSAGFIRNMTVRNNLWITMTGDYLWEDTGSDGTPDNWRTSIDYDGFVWPDSTTMPLFKWHNVRYSDLAALQMATSIEENAIRVPFSCLLNLDVPGPSPAMIPPQHVTLRDGCNAIDAGEVLPNINDGFIGAGPDLGAHESGAPLQHYGPREAGLAPPSPPGNVRVR